MINVDEKKIICQAIENPWEHEDYEGLSYNEVFQIVSGKRSLKKVCWHTKLGRVYYEVVA